MPIAMNVFVVVLWFLFTCITANSVIPARSNQKNLKIHNTASRNGFDGAVRRATAKAWKGGVCGAVAGSAQVISMMWLRTIINYQYRYGFKFDDAVRSLYREGGVKRFYRGLPYALLQNPLSKFGSVGSNEASRVIVEYLVQNDAYHPVLASVVGTVLSAFWKLLIFPLETCKTILQVDGADGFHSLMQQIGKGRWGVLYEGVTASVVATVSSHYPWFFTYNTLDKHMQKVLEPHSLVVRSALIGFIASVVSDVVSNFVRIMKTMKQSMAVQTDSHITYISIVRMIFEEDGMHGIFGRGLVTRIVANGIQSIMFTMIWNYLPLVFGTKNISTNANILPLVSEKINKQQ
jgi:hypothetical protein